VAERWQTHGADRWQIGGRQAVDRWQTGGGQVADRWQTCGILLIFIDILLIFYSYFLGIKY